MQFAELLTARREQIIVRWTQKVKGTLHPASMPRLELVDHLPIFLDEIAENIRLRESPEKSATAAVHGIQRLGLGFNLDSVVREYGALRDCMVEEAGVAGVAIRPVEREILVDCMITGIAEAVSEYQRQRDAEMQRQTSEHFAFVAHELRNPLGTALTALTLLKSADKIADDRLTHVLERSLTRTNELIERSLRLAQIGSGITLRRAEVMLRALLQDAELAATAEAAAKDVELTIHLEKDVPIDVDDRLVQSALTNLLRNAVKFTHEKSRVEVRARVDDARVVIEVEDRCGGLPAGELEQVFAPFVQVGADRSGFGLGLAIARQAADAHGGAIRVQNLPGRGCIFVLELPVATGASAR